MKCSRLKLQNVNSRAAEHGGVAAAQPSPEQQPHAEHHQRIREQIFPTQRGAKRKESVQQLVQWMVDAGLPLASQIEAGEQLRHPVVGLAVGQPLGVEGAEGKMEGAQIVGRVDAAGEERPGQRGQQQQSGQDRPGDQGAAATICPPFSFSDNPLGHL